MSNCKSKFKVEDRVQVVKESYDYRNGGSAHSRSIGEEFTLKSQYKPGYHWKTVEGVDFYEHEIAPVGPIRTVTRLEIVPGVYGAVEISEWTSKPRIKFDAVYPSADDLREAAHLFNQLAEVLEEDSKAAA